MLSRLVCTLLFAFSVSSTGSARGETLIATASNFRSTLNALFEHQDGETQNLKASFASTGKLTSQINRGAPFGLFLSADSIGSRVNEKYAIADSEFTYAYGQLALVSKQNLKALSEAQHFECIAIANASVAPYGRAAEQVMSRLEQSGFSFKRIVRGQSVTQAYQFFKSGACESAFVAFSLVLSDDRKPNHVVIPQTYHQPIRQNAMLLKRAENNLEAKRFFEFLKSEPARSIIRHSGYLTEHP